MANKTKDIRPVVRMRSTEGNHIYYTQKNRRNSPGRLALRKYDPILRRHVVFKESK